MSTEFVKEERFDTVILAYALEMPSNNHKSSSCSESLNARDLPLTPRQKSRVLNAFLCQMSNLDQLSGISNT